MDAPTSPVRVTDPAMRPRGAGAPLRRRRRAPGALAYTAIGVPLAAVMLWVAVHTFPGLGPAIADGRRAVRDVETVARIERFTDRIDDRWNRWMHAAALPRARWGLPSAVPWTPPPTGALERQSRGERAAVHENDAFMVVGGGTTGASKDIEDSP
jgi:hypothetical protein